MAKTKKQMPHILKLSLFLFILGFICAGLLAGVNYLTAPVIEQNKIEEVQKALEEVGLKNAKDVTSNVTLVNGVESIYEGVNDKGEVCYAFNTLIKNQFTSVTTMVVINLGTKAIENIKVMDTTSITTLGPGKDKEFINSDFGVIGKNESEIESSFVGISGATVSTGSVRKAIKASYEQLKAFKTTMDETPMDSLKDIKDVTSEYELVENIIKIESANLNGQTVYIFTGNIIEGWNNITVKCVINNEGVLINISPIGKVHGDDTDPKVDWNDKCLNDNYGFIGSTKDDYDNKFEIITGATNTSKLIKVLLGQAYEQFAKIGGTN